jgi:hypothetical protein
MINMQQDKNKIKTSRSNITKYLVLDDDYKKICKLERISKKLSKDKRCYAVKSTTYNPNITNHVNWFMNKEDAMYTMELMNSMVSDEEHKRFYKMYKVPVYIEYTIDLDEIQGIYN